MKFFIENSILHLLIVGFSLNAHSSNLKDWEGTYKVVSCIECSNFLVQPDFYFKDSFDQYFLKSDESGNLWSGIHLYGNKQSTTREGKYLSHQVFISDNQLTLERGDNDFVEKIVIEKIDVGFKIYFYRNATGDALGWPASFEFIAHLSKEI